MTETPLSLLQRLRQQPDDESWTRLVDLYTPLLQRWLRHAGADGPDADDLLQDVFVVVLREMPSFQHNQQRGAFRCWLRAILINRLRGHWNACRKASDAADGRQLAQVLDQLEDPGSDLNQLWDREHDVSLARRVLDLIEKDFTSSTWHAFHRVVLDGVKPAEVATEMSLSVNAVLLAKSRVLRRARQEIAGLIE